jgi:hypothetical protein
VVEIIDFCFIPILNRDDIIGRDIQIFGLRFMSIGPQQENGPT